MENRIFVTDMEDKGLRLDKWLVEKVGIELSRNAIHGLFTSNSILVNGVSVGKNYRIRGAENVQLSIPEPVELEVKAEDIPIEIVYEDEYLLVVNKPKGMVVHPAPGNYNGTLVNALMYHCKGNLSGINGVIRPGIVHRIDKNTSGLLIVAKNDLAHAHLSQQIKEHSFRREYEAVIVGKFKESSGTIDAPIGRHNLDRKKMCVTDRNSKNAITHYETIWAYNGYSHVRFMLETGRTHQIRVHCTYKGHPVLGDDVYGSKYKGIDGQCLHAKIIGFVHPKTLEYIEFVSDTPDYFKKILKGLG